MKLLGIIGAYLNSIICICWEVSYLAADISQSCRMTSVSTMHILHTSLPTVRPQLLIYTWRSIFLLALRLFPPGSFCAIKSQMKPSPWKVTLPLIRTKLCLYHRYPISSCSRFKKQELLLCFEHWNMTGIYSDLIPPFYHWSWIVFKYPATAHQNSRINSWILVSYFFKIQASCFAAPSAWQ